MLTKIKKVIMKTEKFLLTPLGKIILLGLLIRVLLIPLSLIYDTNSWTRVVRSINSGHGLYEIDAYYYTPTWGYIIGFVSGIQNHILDVGDASSLIPELMSYLGAGGYFPIKINIVFLLGLKIILTISDLILSMLVYDLVKERTNDEKKSTIAFLLVFLCPVVLLTSSITVMPDTISAMFSMLTIFAIKHGKMLSAGVYYSIAVWVKFFPIAIAPLLIFYLLALNKNNIRRGVLKLITALGGFFICSLVIFMPQIQNGELIKCFSFLCTRINFSSYLSTTRDVLLIMGIMTMICIVFYVVGKHMYRSPRPIDDMLMEYSLVIVGLCMLYYTSTQYTLHLIPALVYCISVVDRRKYCVILIGLSIAGLCLVTGCNNVVMLNSLVGDAGLISFDTARSLFEFLNCDRVLGTTIIKGIDDVFGLVQKIFVVLIPLLFFYKIYHKHVEGSMPKKSYEF